MTELDSLTFTEEHPQREFARVEAMMNARQNLIKRHAEHYGIELDDDNRVTGEIDLLDFDPEAYDEWVVARSDMHAICATAAALGCEVSRGEDGAWRISRTQARILVPGVSQAIDPKGRVVLERRGPDALLFRGGAYQPFVLAHGYDGRTGEWSHGNYLDTAAEAAEAINPEAVRHPRNGTRGHREAER